MTRKLRIVNYAVNGSGVGHLTRLVAINRWIRRYAEWAGVRAEIYFLTSSEADGLLFQEGFASFKLPSKTVVKQTGIPKLPYLALAKQWVWHSLGLLRPDLLIVDTFPRGSFGELLSALDLCRQKAFVYRPLKDGYAAQPDFQAMLPLYDAILVPDREADAPVRVPAKAADRLTYTGPAVVRERVELLAREEARRRLGIPPDRLAVYLTAGGGGDAGGEDQLLTALEALREDPSLHLVVGAGPLYRGRRVYGERITWLAGGCAMELFPGFDLALCAAGYNTFFELMHAGVPAIFRPQAKVADEQARRAQRAVDAGAGRALAPGADADALRAAVDAYRSPEARAAAADAGRGLFPRNHARDAAAELLRLVLPAAQVETGEEAVGDGVLRAVTELGLPLEVVFQVAEALDPQAREGTPEQAGLATDEAVELLRFVTAAALPLPAALRVIQPICRKLVRARTGERASAARRIVEAFLPFADWSGAAMVLKTFRVEKELSAADFAAALCEFLDRLRADGHDLYQGLATLSSAQGQGDELPTNRELLRAVGGA